MRRARHLARCLAAAVLTVLGAGSAAPAAASEEGERTMTGDADPARKELAAAVEAARAGDWSALEASAASAQAVAEALAPLAGMPEIERRRELVAHLHARAAPATAPLLVTLLGDASPDIVARAAAALYDLPAPAAAVSEVPGAARAILSAASGPHPGAHAILLLAYVAEPVAVARLEEIAANANAPGVKLAPWHAPVPAALAATVALSRHGEASARDRMLRREAGGPLAETVFLLSVLREIDAPPVLQHLARITLDDTREIDLGVPSGAGPRRRVADLATDRFVARLALDPPFELRPSGRYDASERALVAELLRAAIPG